MGKKLNIWPYLRCYFTYRLHTWYQLTQVQPIKRAFNDPKVKVKIGNKTKQLVISLMGCTLVSSMKSVGEIAYFVPLQASPD